jgi:hypothetical protein
MERRDDGLLDGIEEEPATGTPVRLIAAVLVLEAAVLIATVLSRLGCF